MCEESKVMSIKTDDLDDDAVMWARHMRSDINAHFAKGDGH